MPLSRIKIRWGYLIAFVMMLISYYLIFFIIQKLAGETGKMSESYGLVRNLELIKSELIDAETGVRGYMLTKEEPFLQPWSVSSKRVMPIYDSLEHVAERSGREYKSQLPLLKNLLTRRLHSLEFALQRFRENGEVLTPQILSARETNKIQTDSIRLLIAQMQAHEIQLMAEQDTKLKGFFGSTWLITTTSLAIALITIISSILIYNRESKARLKAVRDSRDYSLQLEQRINELNRVNKELEELKSVEKFTATGRIARTIAHEVRNPLTNISLASEQLKELTGTDPEATLLHDMIGRNATRINQLVSDLLNSTRFAQLEYGSMPICEILEETLEMAADRIELSQVKVEKHYDDNTCVVWADREKMKLAFLNVILNALEAMEKGKGVLQISTRAQQNRCIIEIRDNGVGMDEETLMKLYEPYFTGKPKGNGLGLTNTQNIILNHKGSIHVRSALGKGTVFTITLLQEAQA
jgi:signal transduction histidine kinase